MNKDVSGVQCQVSSALIIGSLLIFIGISYGFDQTHLGEFIEKAEVIVEGVVVDELGASEHKFQGYVGQAKDPILFNFGVSKESYLKVTKVFRGSLKEKETIRIFSFPDHPNDVTELVVDGKYILFLKSRKIQDGFTVCDFGRGSLRVFDHNGTLKVKSWFDLPTLNDIPSYQNYAEFVTQLSESLSLKK